jgi:hypothetical protein
MRRRPLRQLAAPLLVPILVLALAGCGGGKKDSAADVKDKVAAQLVDEGLAREDADCFADVVVDEMGVDGVKDVDFSAERPTATQEEDLGAAAAKGLSDCDIDAGALTRG